MNPISIAARGKGSLRVLHRVGTIGKRYSVTPGKMDRIIAHFVSILEEFNCGATFPITASSLARNRDIVEKYCARNIEFAVHGYYHVDHTLLPVDEQLSQFEKARNLFKSRGLTNDGFRCPYLRCNANTVQAISQAGFVYDGSQGLAWNVIEGRETATYRHVLDFYGAVSAGEYPALPRWDNGLLRIPYCLPDDEALIDRLSSIPRDAMAQPWLTILEQTYRLGELFTLGLHPERIHLCEGALIETLHRAQTLSPRVWLARLDEVAHWWKSRMESQVTVTTDQDGVLHICVKAPAGVTILARGVTLLETSSAEWDGIYQHVEGHALRLKSDRRPLIGVSPSSSPNLISFLWQQGYIVEQTVDTQSHTLYLHLPTFAHEDERPLLAHIEQGEFPLVRLGRWPNGARSALVVTGDIDALTIWDYGLRFFGN